MDGSAMKEKVCLITGATSGIGLVTARELARQGASIVIVGRNAEKCAAAVAQVRTESGNRDVESLIADLASLQQVRDLANRFQERHSRLDVLVNNAGGIWMKRRLTVDDLEMTFAVNHLAYFLLTQLLLDMLRNSAPSRIVNVSSRAHRKATLDFHNLMGEKSYNGWRQYCRSKLMNLLFTYELSRRLAGTNVTVNALHPGWVSTGFAGNNGLFGWTFRLAARCFALSPEQGAKTVIYLASSPEVAGVSGRYFVREKDVPSSPASLDELSAARLWQTSVELSGLESQSTAE